MTYYCDQCSKPFANISNLNRHVRAIHDDLKKYKCDICDKEFAERYNLKSHISTKHELVDNTYTCSTCSKTFSLKSCLTRHVKDVHDKIFEHVCTHCNSKFSSNTKLVRHVDSVHSKIKDLKCGTCNKLFYEQSNLVSHINSVHNNIKPFKCVQCNKPFPNNTKLKRHMKVHMSTYDYVCVHTGCGMLFKEKSSLNRHIANRHSGKIVTYTKREEQRIYDLLVDNEIPFDYNMTILYCDAKDKKLARPDFIIQTNGVILILEVDENSHGHKNFDLLTNDTESINSCKYSVSCDQSRMMEIVASLRNGGEKLPIGFIRYNPHSFSIDNVKQSVSNIEREKRLIKTIFEWHQNQDFIIQYMYYDIYWVDNVKRCTLWDHNDYAERLIIHCNDPIV